MKIASYIIIIFGLLGVALQSYAIYAGLDDPYPYTGIVLFLFILIAGALLRAYAVRRFDINLLRVSGYLLSAWGGTKLVVYYESVSVGGVVSVDAQTLLTGWLLFVGGLSTFAFGNFWHVCPHCNNRMSALRSILISKSTVNCDNCKRDGYVYFSFKRMAAMFLPVVLVCGIVVDAVSRYIVTIPVLLGGVVFFIVLYLASLDLNPEPRSSRQRRLDVLLNLDVSRMKLLVVSLVVFAFSLMMYLVGLLTRDIDMQMLTIKLLIASIALLSLAYVRHRWIHGQLK